IPSDLARQIKRSATLPAVSAPPALTMAESGSTTMQRDRCSRTIPLIFIRCTFRAGRLSARRMHPQHAALHMRPKANSHRGKVAHDFGRIFVKADVKRVFFAQTRSFSEGAREEGFTRACGTGDQHTGAAEVAAAKHRVQPFDAAGHPRL